MEEAHAEKGRGGVGVGSGSLWPRACAPRDRWCRIPSGSETVSRLRRRSRRRREEARDRRHPRVVRAERLRQAQGRRVREAGLRRPRRRPLPRQGRDRRGHGAPAHARAAGGPRRARHEGGRRVSPHAPRRRPRRRSPSVGWCMGGGYSLALALAEPTLAGTVIYYGHLVTEPATIASLKVPLLGNFGGPGSGHPAGRPCASSRPRAKKAGKSVDFKIYPDAGHAFASSTRSEGLSAGGREGRRREGGRVPREGAEGEG